MNIEKMLAAQADLDKEISEKKGLQPTGNMAWKIQALDVELGEMANEWRGFKKWSDDQKPRGEGSYLEYGCNCPGMGNQWVKKNPLLEEYADGVSFFLSIANERGWQDALYLHEEALMDMEVDGLQGGITGAYLEMKYFMLKAYIEKHPEDKRIFDFQANEYFFHLAWMLFVAIGMVGFKFTEEQIEEAYFAKNKINHQRQENGY